MRTRSITLLLLTLAATPGQLSELYAQQQAADLVPKELAIALLPGYSSARTPEPELRVGRTPEGFPLDVLPQGAEVLGSLASFRGTTVVAAMPWDELAAEQALAERLAATGWERKDRSFGRQTGFQVDVPRVPAWLVDSLRASAAERTLHSTMFCRGSTSLQAWALPRTAGGSLLRIEFDERASPFACGRAGDERSVFPLLTAPSGARMMGGGQSAGGGHMDARAHVVSDIGLTGLLTHFAGQLQKAGWSTGARMTTQTTATQQVSFRDAQGQLWQGMLLVLHMPGAKEKEVSIRVTREGAARGEWTP